MPKYRGFYREIGNVVSNLKPISETVFDETDIKIALTKMLQEYMSSDHSITDIRCNADEYICDEYPEAIMTVIREKQMSLRDYIVVVEKINERENDL